MKKCLKNLMIIFLCMILILSGIGTSFYYNIWGNGNLKGKIHFSVDDVMLIFQDLTQNEVKYDSIFDNWILSFFKECHEQYGAKFSLYCFYEMGDFNLSMVPDTYRTEFEENSDWLQFGFHYRGVEEPTEISSEEIAKDYQELSKELFRVTGSNNTTVRLSYFKGSYEMVTSLREQGIKCLLTADDDRLSYYFEQDVNDYINHNDSYYDETNDMSFVSTDLRLDNMGKMMVYPKLIQISKDEKQNKIIAVFAHEWLMDENMFDKIESMCKFAKNYGYEFTLLD